MLAVSSWAVVPPAQEAQRDTTLMNSSLRIGALVRRALPWPAIVALTLLSACRLPWQADPERDSVLLSGTVDAHEVDLSFQAPGRILRLLTAVVAGVEHGGIEDSEMGI